MSGLMIFTVVCLRSYYFLSTDVNVASANIIVAQLLFLHAEDLTKT